MQLIKNEELIWTVNFELDLSRSARLIFNGTGTFYQAIEKRRGNFDVLWFLAVLFQRIYLDFCHFTLVLRRCYIYIEAARAEFLPARFELHSTSVCSKMIARKQKY